jgi:histidinol-phosphatase (PHP family)
MFLCDSHIHSAFSFDGEVPVEEMVKQGIDNNIQVMTITDHCDVVGIGEKNNEFGVVLEEAIPNSVKEIRRVAGIYKDKIKVLAGVELGEPTHFPNKTQIALDLADYDFILASTHEVRGREDFYFLEYNQSNIDTLLWEYFNEQLEVVKWNGFDSLAHFDYPARYIAERTNIKLDYTKYENIIDEILKILIKNNKALEVNTSTISKPLARPMADECVLKRYKELGGKLITLGSDAHTKENLGKDLIKGLEIIKKLGFSSYYYYEKHKGIEVKLQ